MNVASLNLCKELYELSGWLKGTDKFWFESNSKSQLINKPFKPNGFNEENRYPAYDLGYLLKKLNKIGVSLSGSGDRWSASSGEVYAVAKKPTDCVTKLAIELFKQGVLK